MAQPALEFGEYSWTGSRSHPETQMLRSTREDKGAERHKEFNSLVPHVLYYFTDHTVKATIQLWCEVRKRMEF